MKHRTDSSYLSILLLQDRQHQDGGVGETQSPSPHEVQQLDSYPRTKTALGELRNPLKKL